MLSMNYLDHNIFLYNSFFKQKNEINSTNDVNYIYL